MGSCRLSGHDPADAAHMSGMTTAKEEAQNPATTPERLHELINLPGKRGDGGSDAGWCREYVAANPNASAATLRELAADQDDFIWFIASITYLFLILYVWMRSALVALPLLILFVVNTSSDYAAMKPFLDRAVRLVSYLPPGMAEAYDQEADNAITVSLVYLSRVFIGNPGPQRRSG